MLLPIIAATAVLIPPAPAADPATDAVQRVFSCDIGSRMLTVERAGDEGIIEVELHAVNDLGEHVGGTATVSLPIGAP